MVNEQGDVVSSTDLFSIHPQSGEVQILKSLNFESSESTISLSVRADELETTLTDSFTLTLLDINEAPILTLADNRLNSRRTRELLSPLHWHWTPKAVPLLVFQKLDHANFSINVATGEISFKNSRILKTLRMQMVTIFTDELTVSDGKNLIENS